MEPNYTIRLESKDPLTIVATDGCEHFKTTMLTGDCEGPLFSPTGAAGLIEYLCGRVNSASEDTVILTRHKQTLEATFKASAAGQTIRDQMTFRLEQFIPDVALEDMQSDQPTMIESLNARVAELSAAVELLHKRIKVYDDAGILSAIRYRFFMKHPRGMPLISIVTGRRTYFHCGRLAALPANCSVNEIKQPSLIRFENRKATWWCSGAKECDPHCAV